MPSTSRTAGSSGSNTCVRRLLAGAESRLTKRKWPAAPGGNSSCDGHGGEVVVLKRAMSRASKTGIVWEELNVSEDA